MYPFALSEKPGIVELAYYSDDSTDSSASMIDSFRDSKVYRKSFISCHSFDEIDFNDRLAIIKVDVEGAELEVIRGLQNRIITDRPIIIMEILPTYSSENSNRLNRQKQILAILSEANYQFLRIHKSDSEVKQLEKINEIEIHSNLDWCEYLISPAECFVELDSLFDLC